MQPTNTDIKTDNLNTQLNTNTQANPDSCSPYKSSSKSSSSYGSFPDGTPINNWFYSNYTKIKSALQSPPATASSYIITDYGIKDDGNIYTEEFQKLINSVYDNGGGYIIIPDGTYMTGALFFKPGVNLYIEKNGILKGSQDITDYPIIKTRIEGESCLYYAALINASHANGFTIYGEGTIDGNGLHAWKCFWQRRSWNPDCTNKDEQRARLLYIAHSDNVTIYGIHMKDSQFWTCHIYKCTHTAIYDCTISSPRTPVKAPSTDAIDIDACSDVHIKGCHINVNDDAVALKGGKGINAKADSDNGLNERIIIEDCIYDFCHGCLTCGSEAIHNRNIIMRNIRINNGYNLLWLKMRPDTPQLYEHILIKNVTGKVSSFININPWTQFSNIKNEASLKNGSDKPPILLSYINNITMQDCTCECDAYYNVKEDTSQYLINNIQLIDNAITLMDNKNLQLHNNAE
jgi:polygalacturonase